MGAACASGLRLFGVSELKGIAGPISSNNDPTLDNSFLDLSVCFRLSYFHLALSG